MIMEDLRCVSQDERRISLSEVYAIERKLWEVIGVDGPVSLEARRLYRLVVKRYEDIVVRESEETGLHEVEYSLWKLHYVHIEEFRKRFKKSPAAGASKGMDGGIESFLTEAIEYYKGLVGKLKELVIGKDGNGNGDGDEEMPIIRTRKFLLHRFLICNGDLARYKELYHFTGDRDSNWSVAASYYLEATRLWPEGGNPHNQLALLATYVGDDFLALYHCVRSLAVNEPFPDAWKNLEVLLDKSRLSTSDSIPDQASFDFSKPEERLLLSSEEQHFTGGNLWRNFVRTMSFFYVNFSSTDFESSFASMIKELEHVMKLDDASLSDTLGSYQFMNPSRTGPFRTIQAVSVLIFIVLSLIHHHPNPKPEDDIGTTQRNLSVQYAIAAMFIFMGRLVDRCLESAEKSTCPLLPSVLVFSEWLATSNLDSEGISSDNEMSRGATSYFFRSFVRLLNLLNSRTGEDEFEGRDTILWEDYELRGFSAAASAQAYLDFSYDSERVTDFRGGHECRVNRIIISGLKIAEKGSVSYERFVYDEKTKEFCQVGNASEGCENKGGDGEMASEQSVLSRSLVQEEEEVIVFKPLTRHNSAPASKLIMPQGRVSEGDYPMELPAERLHRTSTTLPTQDQGWTEEASSPREFPVSSGPPSLSAWVLDGRSSVFKKEKAENRVSLSLPPIEETMADLSMGRTRADDSVAAPSQESVITHYPCPPYSAVVPSAPLLPEDTVFGVPENYYRIQPGSILHSDQVSARPMTSSEWLRQFREINNLQQGYDHGGPRWHGHDVSVPRYDYLHPWGNGPPMTTAPATDHMLFYSNNQMPQPGYYLPPHGGLNENYRRDRVSYGYPRMSPYGYGASKNAGVEQETLLRYLKQTEWRRLQKDPNL